MNLAKKRQFQFSFFKVDSQNPKFSLEYLVCACSGPVDFYGQPAADGERLKEPSQCKIRLDSQIHLCWCYRKGVRENMIYGLAERQDLTINIPIM